MSLKTEERNNKIYDEYKTGKRTADIAVEYGLTQRTVERIVAVKNANNVDIQPTETKPTEEKKEEKPKKKKKEKEKLKFYSLDNILKKRTVYNVIYSERSNGKTYATLKYGLEKYLKSGYKIGYIRREEEDLKHGKNLFGNLVAQGVISELTQGRYNSVYYYGGDWYLQKIDGQDRIHAPEPFCYGFAISKGTSYKSESFESVKTIIFDEFIASYGARTYRNEFVDLMNLISTIVRNGTTTDGVPLTRDEIIDTYKIFMLGNVINRHSLYFEELGLYHVLQQDKGTIDVYRYGESGLELSCERCEVLNEEKPTDFLFAFNNPKLRAITSGEWELPMFPHKPMDYTTDNILSTFIVSWKNRLLKCDIVAVDDCVFIYVERKTTPIKNPDTELIYTDEYNPKPNYRRNILQPITPYEKKILQLVMMDKVYFQDNDIGDIFHAYIDDCNS